MDIVERLRRINAFLHITEDEPEYDYRLSYEAANEIERLREALKRVVGASNHLIQITKAALKEGE